MRNFFVELQQSLPSTVLKHNRNESKIFNRFNSVATVLTVYGIETLCICIKKIRQLQVATVLTVYGIETELRNRLVYYFPYRRNSTYRLRY